MKKFIITVIALAFIFAVPTMAKNPKSPADYNGLNQGKSDTYHLYLYEKTPSGDWPIVEDGAWGKMTFKYEDKYIFNGHQLNPETNYSLINYGGWSNVKCLGNSMSDEYGDVHIDGILPELVEEPENGVKIWLVPTSTVNCPEEGTGNMRSWTPSEFLFEYKTL